MTKNTLSLFSRCSNCGLRIDQNSLIPAKWEKIECEYCPVCYSKKLKQWLDSHKARVQTFSSVEDLRLKTIKEHEIELESIDNADFPDKTEKERKKWLKSEIERLKALGEQNE